MFSFFPLLPLVAFALQLVEAQSQTWFATSYATEHYTSTTIVNYGSVAVTPVPTSTAFKLVTSYINEPPESRDITETYSVTVTVTEALATEYIVVYDGSLSGHGSTVTSNISTFAVWTSPTLATVTLSTTTCTNGVSPLRTETEYTGKYYPVSGQVTTVPTSWPTAVTSVYNNTAVYHRYTYIGTTTRTTATLNIMTYLSTKTLTTTVPTPTGRYPKTTYLTTVTVTSSDWQLDYITRTVSKACAQTPTVTRAAQCAPTNMISERDGYGVGIQIFPDSWRFPIGFPGEIIGIPGMDAGACCQLCLDNKGCAASEWTAGPVDPSSCRLFYYGYGNSTCGLGAPLKYYASTWDLSRQGSYLQLGCGTFAYMGVHSDIY
jgi:hypothetical protein